MKLPTLSKWFSQIVISKFSSTHHQGWRAHFTHNLVLNDESIVWVLLPAKFYSFINKHIFNVWLPKLWNKMKVRDLKCYQGWKKKPKLKNKWTHNWTDLYTYSEKIITWCHYHVENNNNNYPVKYYMKNYTLPTIMIKKN